MFNNVKKKNAFIMRFLLFSCLTTTVSLLLQCCFWLQQTLNHILKKHGARYLLSAKQQSNTASN